MKEMTSAIEIQKLPPNIFQKGRGGYRVHFRNFRLGVSDMTSQVVRIRRSNGRIVQDCDVYIGRACYSGGWKLRQSKWYNPYTRRNCSFAKEALARYKELVILLLSFIPNSPHWKACTEESWVDGIAAWIEGKDSRMLVQTQRMSRWCIVGVACRRGIKGYRGRNWKV